MLSYLCCDTPGVPVMLVMYGVLVAEEKIAKPKYGLRCEINEKRNLPVGLVP